MDTRVWMEQVEAALPGTTSAPHQAEILRALLRWRPSPLPDDAELLLARAHLAMGEPTQAQAMVPDEPPEGQGRAWSLAVLELVRAGLRANDPALSARLRALAEASEPAAAFDILTAHVELALARGARQVALRGLELLAASLEPRRPGQPPLGRRRRRAAEQEIAALRARILAAPPALPADPDERRLEELAEGEGPELLTERARCFEALGDPAAARAPFERALAAGRSEPALLEAYGQRLIAQRDLAALTALVEAHLPPDGALAALGHALLAQGRFARGALPAARASLDRLFALRPGDRAGRLLLARVLRAEGEEARALAEVEALAAERKGELQVEVERLELAALLDRPEVEAAAARALGLAEVVGPCRLRLPWKEGERSGVLLGPVRARSEDGEELILRLGELEPAVDERGPLRLVLRRRASASR